MNFFSNANRTYSRRRALQMMGAVSASAALLNAQSLFAAPTGAATITPTEDAFLDDLERRGCQYFWEQAGTKTGQVRDRAVSAGKESRPATSIAATGFGLSALCIAHMHGYLPATDVRDRVLDTLRYHLEHLPHEHGFFYHFADIEHGKRLWQCEVSSIDTAIFLCGALTCRAYFSGEGPDTQIRDLATKLYERVEWPWMLNNGSTFSMGWRPESGFIPARWAHYSELMMLYLLAIGSPTQPVPPQTWQNFTRPYIDYAGFHYISGNDPLFTHQYSHAWFDFRHQHDKYADYFANSILATRAHKAFCLSYKKMYSDDFWGVSASDSDHGYMVWGGPPVLRPIDGTVVPCAAAGSLPFLPKDCLRTLMSMKQKYSKYAWGRYGFCDAFHPDAQWYDPDVLGIDQGISVLMAENLRSGFIWDAFMKNPEAHSAMQKVGFQPI
ncbi:MAG: glucoamylase family protein [Acidobacteriaceae bacterium]|nr:glucoamylase family protein [Acidobacteriaceae bacterium]